MKFRSIFMIVLATLIVALLLLTDPDLGLINNLSFGASTIAALVFTFRSFLVIIYLHVARKTLIDYVDLKALFDKAITSSEGAGSAIIGVGLIFLAAALGLVGIAML